MKEMHDARASHEVADFTDVRWPVKYSSEQSKACSSRTNRESREGRPLKRQNSLLLHFAQEPEKKRTSARASMKRVPSGTGLVKKSEQSEAACSEISPTPHAQADSKLSSTHTFSLPRHEEVVEGGQSSALLKERHAIDKMLMLIQAKQVNTLK